MGVAPYGEIAPSNPIDGNFEDAMHIRFYIGFMVNNN